MRYWIGITDWEWFRFLAARPELPEVNFWQPSVGRQPVRLEPGALFLFKLHGPRGGQIVGGGWFLKYEAMPIRWTWDAFGEENGAATFDEMVARIGKYRRTKIDVHADQVGCLVLVEPFFLDESEWIAPPTDWAPNIVQGKGYDSDIGEGARIWNQVQLALGCSGRRGRAAARLVWAHRHRRDARRWRDRGRSLGSRRVAPAGRSAVPRARHADRPSGRHRGCSLGDDRRRPGCHRRPLKPGSATPSSFARPLASGAVSMALTWTADAKAGCMRQIRQ